MLHNSSNSNSSKVAKTALPSPVLEKDMKQPALIAGNWKMNGALEANEVLLREVLKAWAERQHTTARLAVCVPSPYLAQVQGLLLGSAVAWGAQDVSSHDKGAYTGEVSASMLRDFGARYAIVGHSERRQYHGETDSLVGEKAKAALAAGITPIVCVGETLQERELGQTEVVVKRQLAAVIHAVGACVSEMVVAYEPVWAIGTGKTATPEQAQQVHAVLRLQLAAATQHAAKIPLLYGGSMNPGNAASLLSQPDINGGLIGGASLKAADFLAIADVASTFQPN